MSKQSALNKWFKKPTSINLLIKIFSLLTILITLLFLIVVFKNTSFGFKDFDPEVTGQMGDFFGGVVGSLLTFISFLFILKTFEVQLAAVELQKTEMLRNQVNHIHQYIENQWAEFEQKVDKDNLKRIDIYLELYKSRNFNSLTFEVQNSGKKVVTNINLLLVFLSQCKVLIKRDFVLDESNKNELKLYVNAYTSQSKVFFKSIESFDLTELEGYGCYSTLVEINELYNKIENI
ncbi:hypothetical protein [Lacihabitans sp. CS3-21]|uniref:hypothetical protein n=1 Tax=Lacihabitans sp. CS3-21 TaxID=2487332 RepID=UPI0020CCAE0E|nr:hypothetical protein [Lacihabitans sp. CS3-21]MCP9748387.1 hypothetical protein [Lacihabitans sp. CS3-21]